MKINFTSKTIEVTKTFANKASRFGTEEYQMLVTAMQDIPDFKIVYQGYQVRLPETHKTTYLRVHEELHFYA